MNADEIIKTLKWLAKDTEFIFAAESLMTAADLIESLLAKLAAKETTLNGTYISMEAHEREVNKLKAEIGYEQDRIDCRNPVCNGNREGMYRKCAELEELLEAAIAGQETLQKAFAESQRREMEVDNTADFIIQSEDNIRNLENIIISWLHGSEDGE